MLKNKFILTALTILTGLSSIFFGGNVDSTYLTAYADNDSSIGRFELKTRGKLSNTSSLTALSIPNDQYTTQSLKRQNIFRDIKSFGSDIFSSDSFSGCSSLPLDRIFSSESYLNMYVDDNYSATIGFSFNEDLFTYLKNISSVSGVTYNIDAITLDNDVLAYFEVTSSTVNVVYPTHSVTSLKQTKRSETYDGNTYNYFDLVFTFLAGSVGHITKVTTLGYSTLIRTSQEYANFTYSFDKGYIPIEVVDDDDDDIHYLIPDCLTVYYGGYCFSNENYTQSYQYQFILPYDVTYMHAEEEYSYLEDQTFSSVKFSIGNSIYGERYGVNALHKHLANMGISSWNNTNENGEIFNSLSVFAPSTYGTYTQEPENLEDQMTRQASLINRFFMASWLIDDSEVADNIGSGSLVWKYLIPYYTMDSSKSQSLKIDYLTFFENKNFSNNNGIQWTKNQLGYTEYSVAGLTKYVFSSTNRPKFQYFADKVTAKTSVEMFETNISGTAIVHNQTNATFFTILVGILTGIPVFALDTFLGIKIGNVIADYWQSHGLNGQRFYFNFYSTENQVISNVKKIEFKYQMGYQNVNKKENSDGTFVVDYYHNDLLNHPIQTAKEEVGSSSTFPVQNFFHTQEIQTNGFVSIEEDPQTLIGNDGQKIDYNYYYQNVYHSDDYRDFINYFSLLTCWYETNEGDCIRATTSIDGYYLAVDETGKEVVMNIDNPDEPSDMSVNEFLENDKSNQSTHNYDDGEESFLDVVGDTLISSWADFWSQFGDMFSSTTSKILGIISIIALVVIVYFVGKFIYKIIFIKSLTKGGKRKK